MPPVWNRTDYGGDFLAVDPVTAKILAKVAMQAATDSESRKRILFMILAPVIGLLLLIAFILYLITSPFSVLSQWLIGDEVSVVEDFQKEYGYNQQLGIYEKDYIDGSGQSYEGVIFTDGATEVVYYNHGWMMALAIFRMEPIISAVMDVARPLWRLWYPA